MSLSFLKNDPAPSFYAVTSFYMTPVWEGQPGPPGEGLAMLGAGAWGGVRGGGGALVLSEVKCGLFLSAPLLPFTERGNSPLPAAPDFLRWFANAKFVSTTS